MKSLVNSEYMFKYASEKNLNRNANTSAKPSHATLAATMDQLGNFLYVAAIISCYLL